MFPFPLVPSYNVTWHTRKIDLVEKRHHAKSVKDALPAVGLRTSISIGGGASLRLDIIANPFLEEPGCQLDT